MEKDKYKRLKLHFIYVATFLICIIILLVALHCSGNALSNQFMAYAATLSSLILSVLAIIITVLANNSTDGLMHKIRDVYDRINGIPTTIKESTEEMNNASTRINKSLAGLEQLGDKIDSMKDELDKKPSFEAISDLLGAVSSTPVPDKPVADETFNYGLFFRGQSYVGLITIILLVKLCESKKKIELNYLESVFGEKMGYYIRGVIIGLRSYYKLFTIEINGKMLSVKYVDKNVIDKVEEYLRKNGGKSEEEQKRRQQYRDNVELIMKEHAVANE